MVGLIGPNEAEHGSTAFVESGIDGVQIAAATLDDANGIGHVQAKLGSPMYEALFGRMADDVRAGGACLAALEALVGQFEIEETLSLSTAFMQL